MLESVGFSYPGRRRRAPRPALQGADLRSGAFFPIDGAAGWLGTIMRLNPLTRCTHAIRLALRGEPTAGPLALTALFAASMVALATFTVARPASK